MGESGSYVYAVGRDLQPDRLDGLLGLRGAPLRLVEHRGLCAVVSTVDLDEFGEDALRVHLEDLDWLERVARTHDEVIRSLWASAGVVAPFRLATICRTDDNVRHRLDARYDDLVQALDRIDGRSEWSVKAFLVSSAPQAAEADEARPATGTAYLMQRRAQLAQEKQAAVDAEALAEEIHRGLAVTAEACRRLPPQDQRLSGYTDPMVLNGAYLVDDRDTGHFRSAVDELAARNPLIRLTVDGPWPPYSFTTLESP